MQVVVGRIGRPHGLAGEVSVEVRTDDPQRRLASGTTLATEPESAGPLRLEAVRVHSGRLLLRFAGVSDRSAAEALRDVLLVADVDPLERPEDPEEFYDHQLVGLRVLLASGGPDRQVCDEAALAGMREVGTVREVLHLPGQDVLAVCGTDAREVLIPFVARIVPTVDLGRGVVLITPPPGLLEPDEAEVDQDIQDGGDVDAAADPARS